MFRIYSMAIIYGKFAKVFIERRYKVNDRITIAEFSDITEHVNSIEIGEPMRKFAIRKLHAPLLDIAKVHQSILATNPSWTRAVDYNSLFYAVVVECENKPADIGNIAWIELKEL